MDAVYRQLSALFNESITGRNFHRVGGGSINETFRLKLSGRQQFFCKVNSATKFPQLFEKEKNGLNLLAKAAVIQIPGVVHYFIAGDEQVLVLEWMEEGLRNKFFWTKFGEQLAALHHLSAPLFGLDENNFMGSVPQDNTESSDWVSFFIHSRLRPIVKQCTNTHLLQSTHIDLFEKLYSLLPQIFPAEKPSLVHGDLWSGNFMCNEHAEPVLIDPAVYYGHRSVDLAMTTLFGGFDKTFYEAYHYHYPFPGNYNEQWEVCNLYPLLIHLLLFGKSYLYQLEATLKKYQ